MLAGFWGTAPVLLQVCVSNVGQGTCKSGRHKPHVRLCKL